MARPELRRRNTGPVGALRFGVVDPLASRSGAKTPEQEVADILPLGVDPASARRALSEVPFWFHTFALNRAEGIYTPGTAVDHRYRLPFLPASFATLRVLDVGTFDGFYAFVAEARGATRVVAVDSEQHVAWVQARWGVELEGGEGFRAIAELVDSRVEYRRLDASRLDELGETFDFVFCLGILHRVSDPLGLLRMLRAGLADSGRVLLETYGINGDDGSPYVGVHRPGDVYADDEFVYWGFGAEALRRLAGLAGFTGFRLHATPIIDGHPRIIASLMPAAGDYEKPGPGAR
jgi:2-polyprenyl-3-methyl-5-hydroxy-6-metoxy-1,4-benzoquinol methylase